MLAAPGKITNSSNDFRLLISCRLQTFPIEISLDDFANGHRDRETLASGQVKSNFLLHLLPGLLVLRLFASLVPGRSQRRRNVKTHWGLRKLSKPTKLDRANRKSPAASLLIFVVVVTVVVGSFGLGLKHRKLTISMTAPKYCPTSGMFLQTETLKQAVIYGSLARIVGLIVFLVRRLVWPFSSDISLKTW